MRCREWPVQHQPGAGWSVICDNPGTKRSSRYSTPGDLKVWIASDVGNLCILDLVGDDRGVPLPEDDPLLQAIEKQFGEPDYVRVNDQFRIVYRLPNGDTLTLVVHDDKVIDIEHQPLFD